MAIWRRTEAIKPAPGVMPPSSRSEQSSTRFAPPRSAAIADSTESIHTSRSMMTAFHFQSCGSSPYIVPFGEDHWLEYSLFHKSQRYPVEIPQGLKPPSLLP